MHNLEQSCGVAALGALGGIREPGGLGAADEGFAQEGGDPVDVEKHGLLEVAAP